MSAQHHQLHHRSVFQFHQPAFWVFVAFLVYGMVRMVGALVQLSAISRSGWALSWLLLALYAAPLFLLIYYLDPRQDWTGLPSGAPEVAAIALSFPGSNAGVKVEYKINNVLWEQEYGPAQ